MQSECQKTAYVASIEVDGRQKYLFESDKLREMLGASRLMNETRKQAKAFWFGAQVQIFQPASGEIRAWSAEKTALLQGCWKAKKWLTAHGLPHTIALTEVPLEHLTSNTASADLHAVHQALGERARQLKNNKFYPDAQPHLALFANCRIHALDPATRWQPEADTDPKRQHARRGLTGERAEAKLASWEQSKVRLYSEMSQALAQKIGLEPGQLQRAVSFSNLSETADTDQPREDQYIAFVCADGDGMGNLLESLNWNQTFVQATDKHQKQWNEAEPWERNRHFSDAYDQCIHEAFQEALEAVMLNDEMQLAKWQQQIAEKQPVRIHLPLLPQLLGGDDFWMVADRAVALDLCQQFSEKYAQKTANNDWLKAAVEITQQQLSLTISLGVAFAKATYPASAMIDLAEQLLKSAKALRKGHCWGRTAEASACLDWHWIESSRSESLAAARADGAAYASQDQILLLSSKPWPVTQIASFKTAAAHLQKIPRRKREQLETILRLGYRPSLLAWESWWKGLDIKHQEIFYDLNQALPESWQLPQKKGTVGIEPWKELGTTAENQSVYVTPLLDLLALQHVLGLEGQAQEASYD